MNHPPVPLPVILPAYTPSELLECLVSKHRHPTTVIIGFAREIFAEGLLTEVQNQLRSHASLDNEDHSSSLPAEGQAHTPPADASHHTLVRGSLLQTAASRHIRFVFTPTITHLRAYLTVFSPSSSRIPPPPSHANRQQQQEGHYTTLDSPLLLVYGFLELHRGTTEWSAQGLGDSLAALVAVAAATGFRAAVGEPRGAGGHEDLEGFLDEKVVLLSGATVVDESSWGRRQVEIGIVLRRWCVLEEADCLPEKSL